MFRKVVYWETQNVYESFVWVNEFCLWKQVDVKEKENWSPNSFEFHINVATDEQFNNRIDGLIRM